MSVCGTAHAATFTVSTLADSGAGSLRQAITDANGTAANDAITFAVTGTIRLLTTLPNLTANSGTLTISNTQSGGVTLSGDANNSGTNNSGTNDTGDLRILVVNTGATVSLSNLTLAGGRAQSSGQGGAILNFGTLTLTSSTLSGNSTNSLGGAIYSTTTGVSTTTPNPAQFTLLQNCTLSGNIGRGVGGGVYNSQGLTRIESCTIAGNSAPAGSGAGVFSFGDDATRTRVQNSLIADNRTSGGAADSGTDADFAFGSGFNSSVSGGNNAIGDGNATSAFTGTGDTSGVTAAAINLGALAPNGGPTQTRALGMGSVAIDTGSTTLTVDQRGVTRPQGVDDKGAFELATDPTDPTGAAGLVVTTTADVTAADGLISLREAITTANTDGVGSAISFDETVFAAPRKVITLGGTQLALANNGTLSITAPSAGVEISGGGRSRVFSVSADANVTLRGLTITGGAAGTNRGGGGILTLVATVLVDGCTLSGNTAFQGGAIFSDTNLVGATLTIRNSTLSGNTATGH